MLGFMSVMNESMSASVSASPISAAMAFIWSGVGTETGMASSFTEASSALEAPGRLRSPARATGSRREIPQELGIALHFLRRPRERHAPAVQDISIGGHRERQLEVLLHDHEADACSPLLEAQADLLD